MTGWPYPPPASYQYTPARPAASGRLSTSSTEITHLLIAAVVLTADITLISVRTFSIYGYASVTLSDLLVASAFGATAALTGFVFHELAHKVAAQRRGYWAEFRMSPMGLLFSIITSFFGFLFAAPGATVVQGMGDRRDWGWTSLAGPTTNLIEGGAFLGGALLVFELQASPVLLSYLLLLAFFNGWFATFNLIPFGPLDGRKVLGWSAGIWAAAFVVSAALAVSMFLLYFGYVAL
jgi:Zn-dependent protease